MSDLSTHTPRGHRPFNGVCCNALMTGGFDVR